jgi:hypothetical protein
MQTTRNFLGTTRIDGAIPPWVNLLLDTFNSFLMTSNFSGQLRNAHSRSRWDWTCPMNPLRRYIWKESGMVFLSILSNPVRPDFACPGILGSFGDLRWHCPRSVIFYPRFLDFVISKSGVLWVWSEELLHLKCRKSLELRDAFLVDGIRIKFFSFSEFFSGKRISSFSDNLSVIIHRIPCFIFESCCFPSCWTSLSWPMKIRPHSEITWPRLEWRTETRRRKSTRRFMGHLGSPETRPLICRSLCLSLDRPTCRWISPVYNCRQISGPPLRLTEIPRRADMLGLFCVSNCQ